MDQFGSLVALNADGSNALIGVFSDAVNGNAQHGSAYVYRLNGTAWMFQNRFLSPDGDEGDRFGTSGSINADGNLVVVGADKDMVNAQSTQGSA